MPDPQTDAPAAPPPAPTTALPLKAYRYRGPLSSADIVFGKPGADGQPADVRTVAFHPGRTYELPADDGYVKTLVEFQHLVLVEVEPAAKAEKKKGGK